MQHSDDCRPSLRIFSQVQRLAFEEVIAVTAIEVSAEIRIINWWPRPFSWRSTSNKSRVFFK
jgi:hypothetical protein